MGTVPGRDRTLAGDRFMGTRYSSRVTRRTHDLVILCNLVYRMLTVICGAMPTVTLMASAQTSARRDNEYDIHTVTGKYPGLLNMNTITCHLWITTEMSNPFNLQRDHGLACTGDCAETESLFVTDTATSGLASSDSLIRYRYNKIKHQITRIHGLDDSAPDQSASPLINCCIHFTG